MRTTLGGGRSWDAIRPIYWKMASAVAGDGGVALEFPDGHPYRIDPRFYAWQMDQYEPAVVEELTRTMTKTAVVYDVGAHVGIMTLMAARRVDCGRVYAFEPSPPNFDLLQRHIRINGYADRVISARVLVGDQVSDAVPFVHRTTEFTANSLAYSIEGGTTTLTPMTTIDETVGGTDARPPTHLKIDVEGFEAAVLRGATKTLRMFRPLVICAIHPEPLAQFGESSAGIVRFLAEHGYAAFSLKGEPVCEPGFEEVVFRPVE